MKEGYGERVIKGKFEGDERFFAFYTDEEFRHLLNSSSYEVLDFSKWTRDRTPRDEFATWLTYIVRVR